MTRLPCPLCRRRLPTVPAACEPCRTHIARQLSDVTTLLDVLRRAADHANDDLDPVNSALPAGPVVGAPSGPIARHGGLAHSPAPQVSRTPDETTVPDSVRALINVWGELDWLTQTLDKRLDGPRAAEFAAALRAAWLDLRRAAGYRYTLIGYCPTEDCGAELLADPRATAVTCEACGTAWPRRHWLWLTDTLRAA